MTAAPPPAERMLDFLGVLRASGARESQLAAWSSNPDYLITTAAIDAGQARDSAQLVMAAARLIRAAELLDACDDGRPT